MIVSGLESLEAGAEEVCQEVDGDGAGLGLLTALAADEAGERLAGVRDEGEGYGELLALVGVGAVLEGVEVAPGGAGAGPAAAAARGLSCGLVRHFVVAQWRHCEGMVGCMFWRWKGDVSGGAADGG